jgi:hypothetical protein
MKRLIIAVAVALALTTSVRAANITFYTGVQAYEVCAGVLNDGQPDKVANCTGYVIGVLDALATVREAEGSAIAERFCVPSKLLSGAVTEVFARYLLAHPEQRKFTASSLVLMAMIEAFPCK